jgi:hypothetical protein
VGGRSAQNGWGKKEKSEVARRARCKLCDMPVRGMRGEEKETEAVVNGLLETRFVGMDGAGERIP